MAFSIHRIAKKARNHELTCGMCRFLIRKGNHEPGALTKDTMVDILTGLEYDCPNYQGTEKLSYSTPNCDSFKISTKQAILNLFKKSKRVVGMSLKPTDTRLKIETQVEHSYPEARAIDRRNIYFEELEMDEE